MQWEMVLVVDDVDVLWWAYCFDGPSAIECIQDGVARDGDCGYRLVIQAAEEFMDVEDVVDVAVGCCGGVVG